jgi:hypothetical protein
MQRRGAQLTYQRDVDVDDERGGARPRHPHDPRNDPRHRERGPARYPRRNPGWTMEMVARAAGRSVEAVRKAARRGRLDIDDLSSVAAWIASRKKPRERRDRD